MTLGYRAFFNVSGSGDLLHLVDEQTFSWLTSKRWRYEDLSEGALAEVARNTKGVVLTEDALDGSRTKRYRFIQSGIDGQWITELTTHVERGGSDGWVWLDIDQPDSAPRTGTPRLASMLVEVLAVSDGRHPLTSRPVIAGVEDVPAIVDSVLDPSRQGLLFLAGSTAESDIPLHHWATYVEGILRETVGLSSSYVLNDEATREFNRAVPVSHSLREYTIRTFRPEVQFDEPLDGQRHRILSTRSIIHDDPRYLRRLLGNRAREIVISGTLPSAVRRLDRRLRDQLDSLLTEAPSEARAEHFTEVVAETPDLHPRSDNFRSLLTSIIGQVLGESSLTEATLRRLGQLALDAKSAMSASQNVKQRLSTLENRVDAADETIRNLRQRLEDEQLETASATGDLAESERQLRYFRSQLASTGRGDIAWSAPAVSAIDVAPESFDELLDRIDELEFVEFTGDPDRARDLDDHEVLGVWAGHCWRALLALNDYAEQSASSKFSGSVDTYLSNTPTGCHSFSTNRHAPFESSDVANNPKYRAPRTLPVPRGVDSSRFVYMEAHFKIAKSATITPRMHYFDDTARSGKLYVGYIGRHLPSSMTN